MKNKIKVYLRTKSNLEEQAKVYSSIFKGKILKNSVDSNNNWNYAYVNIFNDINIMIARYNTKNMPKFGYCSDIVISLSSLEEMKEVFKKMKNSDKFIYDYGIDDYSWGTSICKFYDIYGFAWILEAKSE